MGAMFMLLLARGSVVVVDFVGFSLFFLFTP